MGCFYYFEVEINGNFAHKVKYRQKISVTDNLCTFSSVNVSFLIRMNSSLKLNDIDGGKKTKKGGVIQLFMDDQLALK